MCEILSFIGSEVAKTVIALGTTAIAGGVVWGVTIGNRTRMLNALLSNPDRAFILYYRGEEDVNNKKTITFKKDGTIGEGSNSNESRWEIRYGVLKIFTNKNVKFSAFKWDRAQGKLVHINDPRLPSVMGQYIVPSYIPARSQGDIYADESNPN